MKALVKVLILREIFKCHASNKWYIALDELSDVCYDLGEFQTTCRT